MFGLSDKELSTHWKEGPRVWKLVDITTQAEEPYFHLELVKGKYPHPTRVVDEMFFRKAVQVIGFKVWCKVA